MVGPFSLDPPNVVRMQKKCKKKMCDLPNWIFEFRLTGVLCRTDVDRLIDQILLEEPLISESRKPQLKKLIESKFIS